MINTNTMFFVFLFLVELRLDKFGDKPIHLRLLLEGLQARILAVDLQAVLCGERLEAVVGSSDGQEAAGWAEKPEEDTSEWMTLPLH